MKEIIDYFISGVIIIFALYFVYTQVICNRSSNKFYNDSWRTRNKK